MSVDVAGLRKLCSKATEGPWCNYDDQGYEVGVHSSAPGVIARNVVDMEMPIAEFAERQLRDDANFRFIAAARTALPALLDRIEELEREREALLLEGDQLTARIGGLT